MDLDFIFEQIALFSINIIRTIQDVISKPITMRTFTKDSRLPSIILILFFLFLLLGIVN